MQQGKWYWELVQSYMYSRPYRKRYGRVYYEVAIVLIFALPIREGMKRWMSYFPRFYSSTLYSTATQISGEAINAGVLKERNQN